ncbi:ABC transporter substrate-binding protein [Pelagibacterium xiamenense]|uniref:ABC transporter substrate-binding protein n=1 Tax=Pelagibacterium xiamenense TaxID=2901140 RepID=UPI001E3AC071|nr:iron-siderophore ABC transporter substrate-binding protein [Pelagibacterium xiamenense]MCD7059861.1 iron-siderophore ABC transporter substrate-binding protein [Pelagibacterium xiamenense]
MPAFRHVLAAVSLAAALVAPALAGAREVTHAMGTTEVPDAPARIVVLTNEGTEALLALGVTPVGAVKGWSGDPWYDHTREALADTTALGEESAVNLEMIAALQPDLIIGNKARQEGVYEQLSAIAPTVMSERLRGDWQINFEFYADAVGKHEEGQAVLADFAERVEAIAAALGDRVNEEISLVRFMPGRTRIYLKDTFAGIILDQIGFARPEIQDRDEFADEVGKERIPDFDGDRMFYFVYETGDGEGDSRADEWMADPLWANLEVVQAGNVQPVNDAIWNTAGGVIAANLMLDDIVEIYGLDIE